MSGSDLVKVLVIEDEPAVRTGLEENLKLEGFSVISCDNGSSGIERFKEDKPQLVILDLMMPGLDGMEVCKQLRAIELRTPIIMLTAKDGEIDKVLGLELGADDYLTKPFGMRELFARIKALLRRSSDQVESKSNGKDLKEVSFGDVSIDFQCYRAFKNGKEICLSAKEFDLLKFLFQNVDIPVSRDQLLDQVWGYNSYPTTRTVDNFIARLRHKVEKSPEKPRHIITVHGVGYKFVV
jgi:DNA-binding response OmpR family regulator